MNGSEKTKVEPVTTSRRNVKKSSPVTNEQSGATNKMAPKSEDQVAPKPGSDSTSTVEKLVKDARTAADRNLPKVEKPRPASKLKKPDAEPSDAIQAAQEEAERAAVQLQERVAASVRVAEVEADRLTGRLLDQVQAMQSAADGIPVRIAEKIQQAETETDEMVEKAVARTKAGVRQAEDVLDCVQTLIDKQVTAAELASEALTEQVSRNVETTRRIAADTGGRSTARPSDVLQTAGTAGADMFANVARAQMEASEFVTRRVRQDFEVSSKLMSCQSFDQVREVQAKFFQTAMEDYSKAASRLFRMSDTFTPKALQNGDD